MPITLVWLAGGAPIETSYTVFAQLIGEDGRVIAQSDAIPANFARPTTGWRAGEYIVDEHVLRFNENATAGTGTLIVGMYDAATFERVLFMDGADSVTLTTIEVE